jgi:hypothetical protein
MNKFQFSTLTKLAVLIRIMPLKVTVSSAGPADRYKADFGTKSRKTNFLQKETKITKTDFEQKDTKDNRCELNRNRTSCRIHPFVSLVFFC